MTPSMSSSVSSASEISSDEDVPPSARSTTYSKVAAQAQAQTPYLASTQGGSTLRAVPGSGPKTRLPMSRSASRARIPIRDAAEEDEDDEVPVRDRGEDLIRRRMKERKKAKKRASRRAERGETWYQTSGAGEEPTPMNERGDPFMSMPTTPAAGPQTFGMAPASRSASRSRGVSMERRSSYGTGSGYFAQSHAGYPTDATLSPGGSTRYNPDEEEDERKRGTKAPSLIDEVVQEVVEEDARSRRTEEEEDEDEDDDDDDDDAESPDGDDEGVTLRDRQDVSSCAFKPDFRLSTLNIPSVCRSGSQLCTKSRAQSLAMPTTRCTRFHQRQLNAIFFLATSSGSYSSAGGSHSSAGSSPFSLDQLKLLLAAREVMVPFFAVSLGTLAGLSASMSKVRAHPMRKKMRTKTQSLPTESSAWLARAQVTLCESEPLSLRFPRKTSLVDVMIDRMLLQMYPRHLHLPVEKRV